MLSAPKKKFNHHAKWNCTTLAFAILATQ